jgi:hypothetical protein
MFRTAAPGTNRMAARWQEALTGYEECMECGMPGYKRTGLLEVSFASQKKYSTARSRGKRWQGMYSVFHAREHRE